MYFTIVDLDDWPDRLVGFFSWSARKLVYIRKCEPNRDWPRLQSRNFRLKHRRRPYKPVQHKFPDLTDDGDRRGAPYSGPTTGEYRSQRTRAARRTPYVTGLT